MFYSPGFADGYDPDSPEDSMYVIDGQGNFWRKVGQGFARAGLGFASAFKAAAKIGAGVVTGGIVGGSPLDAVKDAWGVINASTVEEGGRRLIGEGDYGHDRFAGDFGPARFHPATLPSWSSLINVCSYK